MGTPWEEDEVYRLKMNSPLSDLHGVGPTSLRVFAAAGFTKIGDLYGKNGQEVAVRDAARNMAEVAGTADDGHWRALASYCATIIRRVRSAEAQPFVPEHFLCPILYTCMEDPVITRHGFTYERHAIERVANETVERPTQRRDPLAGLPIGPDDLFPNRALKASIEFHFDHFMRFAIPYKA